MTDREQIRRDARLYAANLRTAQEWTGAADVLDALLAELEQAEREYAALRDASREAQETAEEAIDAWEGRAKRAEARVAAADTLAEAAKIVYDRLVGNAHFRGKDWDALRKALADYQRERGE